MSECEINSTSFNATDNGRGNNRWIANSGYFDQIIRAFDGNDTKLSYVQIGGNAYVYQYYPSAHITKTYYVALRPTVVTGGEIKECFMTGNHSTAQGTDIYFWCAGGLIHKYLSAYTTNITTPTTNVTAHVDHAIIGRFFGGGTSSSAPITGDISITMNNSKVDFFCGGPEFGDMSTGKAVTTHAKGSTFGEYYGAGLGGTSLSTIYTKEKTDVDFGSATVPYTYNISDSYDYLKNYIKDGVNYGIGIGYAFDFIMYSGGKGKGVARFYNKYARFSLATTGDVTNELKECSILNDFYGAGCQGKVNGTVNSTLTDCIISGNVFGGGFKAESNSVDVYPMTQPSKSVYTKETGLFSDFGTVDPEEWKWEQGTEYDYPTRKEGENVLLTSNTINMTDLGNVTGAITITVDGTSTVGGSVYGGGNESKSYDNATVTIGGEAAIAQNVFGGGNIAFVDGASGVNIEGGSVAGSVFGGGNAAKVSGSTFVNIGTESTQTFQTDEQSHGVKGADIRGNVYGGGNSADVAGKTNVVIGAE